MLLTSQNKKLPKFFWFLQCASREIIPSFVYNKRMHTLIERYGNHQDSINRRVAYYNKQENYFSTSNKSFSIKNFKWMNVKRSAYYFDLKQYLFYFPKTFKIDFRFGDDTHLEEFPFIVKARPVGDNNQHAVLMNLDKRRHFQFISDPLSYENKKDMLVWRGAVHQPHRKYFVEKFYQHPRCNVGQTNNPKQDVPWQKEKMTIAEQQQYKFILAIEGNDVATGLKWALASNSLCFMTKPKFETWFMEGRLEEGIHYVQLKDDYLDLDEKMDFYLHYPEKAEEIIDNAHQFIEQFKNPEIEDLVSYFTLKRYFELSGQYFKNY